MFGMNVLEVIIGLLFVYLLLSLLASIISEIITGLLSLRGRFLLLAISKLINDENNDLSKGFVKHPFFQKISPPSQLRWFKKVKLPSYLSKQNFSKIFVEALVSGEGNFKAVQVSFEKVKERIINLKEGQAKEFLLSLVNEAERAEDKLEKFMENLEESFDTLMDRASGWYKRRAQFFLFMIGLVIAILFNADTFFITNRLSQDPELRREMVAMAQSFQATADSVGIENFGLIPQKKMDSAFAAKLQKLGPADSAQISKLFSNSLRLQQLSQENVSPASALLGLGSITDLKIPPDRNGFWPVTGWIIVKILGWLLTALAISLGAPFWFDVLNKVMKVRSSGKVPDTNLSEE